MNKITKDNKGITLVALIMTVILMLILISVTTYTGINTYKESKVTAFVSQMQLIQSKVDNIKNEKTIDELILLGDAVDSSNQISSINSAFSNSEITSNDISSYRYFTKSKLLELFDIEDAYDDVMINFTTREVVSLNGVEHKGSKYYTQYKLPNGQTIINNDNSITRDLDFTVALSIDGINSTITIKNIKITNGTLSYKEQNDNYWQNVTNYTEKDKTYDILISKTGEYTFKLQDNTSSENYIEKTIQIKLTNKPKTSLTLELYNYGADSDSWAYVQKDSANYVWIPRFVYKIDSNTNTTDIKFVKGNSNIATDNTYINDEWTLHDKFTADDGTELTGVWISVDSIDQQGLNMIDLLNDSDRTTLTEI